LKRILLLICLTAICGTVSAQHFYLKIAGNNDAENKVIDSIGYTIQHQNYKSVADENTFFYEKLTKLGYLETQLVYKFKPNDSTITFTYDLKVRTTSAHLYISHRILDDIATSRSIHNDTLILPYEEIEGFLNATLKKLEIDGYSMAKVKLVSIQKKNKVLLADVSVSKERKRVLNDIVINGYEKFPEGHKKNLLRFYRHRTFNQKNLDKLSADVDKFRFVKQSKYPEILFTADSTRVYLYLEKAKVNTFDGYIGFTNDENKKLIFSGYLDLVLNNILNAGEKLALYWKSDGQKQKTFNLDVEVPYIFKSPIGVKAELNIFKQDSTFQNTRTGINVGYYFNYNTRLYLGYQSTESSDIQNTNTLVLSDFNNSFTTTSLDYVNYKNEDYLFPEKTNLALKIGIGKRETKLLMDKQLFIALNLSHNFYLNSRNIINIKSQNYYLQSDHFIVNELHRFGGITSLRGFNENSLQANTFTSLLTEYRFILAPSLYIHSIIDYAQLNDTTSKAKEHLLGLGVGFGLVTKNGLFNIVYANGSSKEQTIKSSNSIIHISFKANF